MIIEIIRLESRSIETYNIDEDLIIYSGDENLQIDINNQPTFLNYSPHKKILIKRDQSILVENDEFYD